MPILSFRCPRENELFFELLVDGEPLGALVGSQGAGIPARIVDDGLPGYPPYGESSSPEIRIVCVCNCGDYGCDHTQCRVTRVGDEVVFDDFTFDVSSERAGKEFRFAAENYDAVCREVAALALQNRLSGKASFR